LQTYQEKKTYLEQIMLFQHLQWHEKDVLTQALLYQRFGPGDKIICE
jgi:hypothetical protein